MGGLKIGIAGCTGAVGVEILKCMKDCNLDVDGDALILFASERSAGKLQSTPWGDKAIRAFSVEEARHLDIVFLAVSGDFAKANAPALAVPGGPIVIDNSSAFRYDPQYPLVVPEINGCDAIGARLIANPNCTTAIAAMALWPLHCRFGIRRMIVSTYQAASGAGAEGMDELEKGIEEHVRGGKPGHKVFPHPLPFNVIPHIDKFQNNRYTKEEMKVAWETRKIFHADDIAVSCTAVRVPTLRAHAEAITIECVKPITADDAAAELVDSPGVELIDNPANAQYPMPLNSSSKADIGVGRLRQSLVFGRHGLDLFVCGDQLLRGAALNAVLIAKLVTESKSPPPPMPRPPTASRQIQPKSMLTVTMAGLLPLAAVVGLVLRDGRSGTSSNALGKVAVFLGGLSMGAMLAQRPQH